MSLTLDTSQLLPHQPPMRLLERVLATQADVIWASIDRSCDSEILQAKTLPSLFAIEYVAQAAAALIPLSMQQTTGTAVQPVSGMLVAVRSCTLHDVSLPPASPLIVRAAPLGKALPQPPGLARFQGEVFLAPDEVIASKVAELDELSEELTRIANVEISVYLTG